MTTGGGTGEVDDGDYDADTNWVRGNVMDMLPRGTGNDPLDHSSLGSVFSIIWNKKQSISARRALNDRFNPAF